MKASKRMRPLGIAQLLLLVFVLSFVSLAAQDRRNDSPENRAAWRLIARANTISNFTVKDMKIIV